MIDGNTAQLDVTVLRLVSPLDTGSIHGRGQGVLRRDTGVAVTFLIDHADFISLRQQMLSRGGEVDFIVALADVTAIDAARDRLPAPGPAPRQR